MLDVAASVAYLSANGYATCTGACATDADCGAGGTCNVAADPCACNTCTQGPECSANGTCNAQCAPGTDPDCGPDCSADGNCNALCAPGADPDCTCLSKGASCTSGSQCCSNKCAGKSGKKTCK